MMPSCQLYMAIVPTAHLHSMRQPAVVHAFLEQLDPTRFYADLATINQEDRTKTFILDARAHICGTAGLSPTSSEHLPNYNRQHNDICSFNFSFFFKTYSLLFSTSLPILSHSLTPLPSAVFFLVFFNHLTSSWASPFSYYSSCPLLYLLPHFTGSLFFHFDSPIKQNFILNSF